MRVIKPPLLAQTIPEHFKGVVREYGDGMAVIAHRGRQRKVLSYRELDEGSGCLVRFSFSLCF